MRGELLHRETLRVMRGIRRRVGHAVGSGGYGAGWLIRATSVQGRGITGDVASWAVQHHGQWGFEGMQRQPLPSPPFYILNSIFLLPIPHKKSPAGYASCRALIFADIVSR